MHRAGVIQSFDGADGLGDVLLDDGTVVRFGTSALKDFRSVVPAPGVRVLVGETKPGFRGALRASEVRLAEASWDETWHVFGVAQPRIIESEPGRHVRLVPFDTAAFSRLGRALSKDDVDGRSFAGPAPARIAEAHPVMSSLVPVVSPHARVALGFSRVPGEPAPGATFVGGSYADLPGEWPTAGGAPLVHVLQIGKKDAEALGFPGQINVFTGSAGPASLGTPVLEALGMASLFGAMPRGDSPFPVVASPGGPRRGSLAGATPAIAFGGGVPRTVFPSHATFRSMDAAVQAEVSTFFGRAYVVDARGHAFAPDVCLRSVQAYYAAAFPSADQIGDDLVLGGIAPPLMREGSPRMRLASLALEKLSEIRPVIAHGDAWLRGEGEPYWKRWAIDWSEGAAPQSWAYGR